MVRLVVFALDVAFATAATTALAAGALLELPRVMYYAAKEEIILRRKKD